ncbi:protein kinase [Kitasatospora sp. MBT66]|uniref:protein kinase domain-containing protein n=1 Tax=Kitasatospora sp. MBT66 TaxID=1444769 RepID=UPI000AB2D192|nr:protein kinase [Kitasatospora sp. MBT66]
MTLARVIGGRYHLTEKIGHGGMGQVWAGHDERLARPVAVKLLRTDLLLAATGGTDPTAADRLRHGDDLRRRFLRECRTTAALDHPGLVTVFDAGEEGGELYLVMQRVPGVSLADLIAEDAPFPVERAVAVAAQLCAALAAVHAVRVVHRDLKPSNVMVREDGRTVLLDLGIATALDPEATRLTLTGVPIGSPSYMAPEQALSAAVDPRSDLYALGCLLHEMLTGEGPFRAPTALGLLRRHVDDPPVPLRDLRPEVPSTLERLVLDLLAKRPGDRPADAQEVYGRLLPLLPAAVSVPQPRFGPLPDPARPYRYPLQPQPRPEGVAPAAPPRVEPPPFLLAAVPNPPAPAVPQGPRPAPAPASASAPPVPAEEDFAAACARLSDLVDAGRRPEVLDLAARLLARGRSELGDGAGMVRTVRTIYARTLLQERRHHEALAEYRALAATAEGGPHGRRALEPRHRVAECLEQLGRGAEALTEYQALLAVWPETEPERLLDLRERVGVLLASLGETEAAWSWLLQLLFDRERRDGPHHPAVRRLRQTLDTLQSHRTNATPWPPRA